jgi:hypothetical protein
LDIVLLIHLAQYQKTLCPKYRRQLSHLILFAIESQAELKSIFNEFGGNYFNGLDEFKHAHDIATEGDKCMIISIHNKSNKIEEKVFWFNNVSPKEKVKPQKLGAPWFQKLQKEYYNPEWITEQSYEPYVAPEKGKRTKTQRKIALKQNDIPLNL